MGMVVIQRTTIDRNSTWAKEHSMNAVFLTSYPADPEYLQTRSRLLPSVR